MSDNPAQDAAESANTLGSTRVSHEVEAALQLGSFLRSANGEILMGESKLLRNIEGLPLPLHKIATMRELIGAYLQFFTATYVAYGLDPKFIVVWYILLRPADGKVRTHGPFTNDQPWGAVVKQLSELVSNPCEKHQLPRCALCQATPIIVACFDDMHLRNALATRCLAPGTQIDFLDYDNTALNDMYMSASDTLRQSIANLRRKVLGKPFRALATPYSMPVCDGDEYLGSLILSAPRFLGLNPGVDLGASVQITVRGQGAAPVQVQNFSAQWGRHYGTSIFRLCRTHTAMLPSGTSLTAAHQAVLGLPPRRPLAMMTQTGDGAINANGKHLAAKSTLDDREKTSPSEEPTRKPR